MKKYHINHSGNVGACRATSGGCPFASAEDHYFTQEEARQAFEAETGSSFPILTEVEPLGSVFRAPSVARESKDPEELMSVARGGNKRAIRELAANPSVSAEVLAEASSKVSEDSKERKALEAHPNFPLYAMSVQALETKNGLSYAVKDLDPTLATDNLVAALVKSDLYGADSAGLKARAMLSEPDNAISDSVRCELAGKSELYAEAAARSGKFPTASFLNTVWRSRDNAVTTVYAVKGMRDGETIRRAWIALKDTDWGTWGAQNMLANPHTPRDLRSDLQRRAAQPQGLFGGGSISPSTQGNSRSSSSDSLLSPTNPASPIFPTNL